ncbi:MAG: diacylglycerol kinase family protein [Bacilli bacterium]
MRALFLYNPISGKGLTTRQITYIYRQLSSVYEKVDYQLCQTDDELSHFVELSCGQYEVLIFAGGDGTFHHILNALKDHSSRPIIGIIPCGTLNDASKNFGYRKSISQALQIIKKGYTRKIDVFKANDVYGVFSLSVGTFSSIPYLVKHNKKKRHGRWAYYWKALSSLCHRHQITGEVLISSNQQAISFQSSFILFLNSAYMGGFKINSHSSLDDGYIDFLYTDKGWFNGLFRYFFRRHLVNHYSLSDGLVKLERIDDWDIDGEKMTCQEIHIQVLKDYLQVISNEHF